jgi:hypothetical protein
MTDRMRRHDFDYFIEKIVISLDAKNVNKDRIERYWQKLKHIPNDRLSYALYHAETRFNKFPSMAQIIELTKEFVRQEARKDRSNIKYVTLQEALNDPDPYFHIGDMRFDIREEWEKLPPEIKTMFEKIGGKNE